MVANAFPTTKNYTLNISTLGKWAGVGQPVVLWRGRALEGRLLDRGDLRAR